MRRLRLLLAGALFACLLLGTGCLTEEDKRGWQEALKDLRGDNMKMRSREPKDP
jgi:hypothetical protein